MGSSVDPHMGEGQLRYRLRFLRLRRRRRNAARWLNDAPRAPPIPAAGRISDASSALTEDTGPPFLDLDNELDTDLDLASIQNDNSDVTCLICLDVVNIGSRTIVLPTCTHAPWHAHCLRKWLRQAPRCPLCASVVPTSGGGGGTVQQHALPHHYRPERAQRYGYSLTQSISEVASGPSMASPTLVNGLIRTRRLTSGESVSPSRELPWTLSERRVHENFEPRVIRRAVSSSQDLDWVLVERRMSLVTRPTRWRRCVRLPQSLSVNRR